MRINQLIQISPSIMCADLCNMEDELRKLESIGVDLLHFDLMDSHFVPNMPLGLVLLEQLRSKKGNLGAVDDSHFLMRTMLELPDLNHLQQELKIVRYVKALPDSEELARCR